MTTNTSKALLKRAYSSVLQQRQGALVCYARDVHTSPPNVVSCFYFLRNELRQIPFDKLLRVVKPQSHFFR